MSEVHEAASPAVRSAGAILRDARLAQGVHIAALAATMKVSQRKLEALEADRFDELPDATFARALAQAVCRVLKTDPGPVLALLPQHAGHRLEHVAEGLKQPFHERAGRIEPSEWAGGLSSTTLWGVLAIAVLTALVWLLPQQWLSGRPAASTPAPPVAVETAAPPPAIVPVEVPWAPAAAGTEPAGAPAEEAPLPFAPVTIEPPAVAPATPNPPSQ
jgi:cytoskeleton protein RodZ